MKRILITGVDGQIGSELFELFRQDEGVDHVVGLDIRPPHKLQWSESGLFEIIDATDKNALREVITKYEITTIFHLVGILSAKGENDPDLAWRVNMDSLKNILDLAREYKIRVFWPSSIAAFGRSAPHDLTPQNTILDPTTIYGITKVAGELLCNYYFSKFGVDVRSIRFPGIISYDTPPGGGTTDYAVEMFYYALRGEQYPCFVTQETTLPMMYMSDAIKSIIDVMHADGENIKVRTSYNVTGVSFSARELELEIKKHFPEFSCLYKPDYRQHIADSWPRSIDDSAAREQWSWQHEYGLKEIVTDMITNLQIKAKTE
ncbi:NAD-dependent epimerase/dehydratase family protein [candidate division KSB1 bacterium]|nr:NAD-dependent epimerase/dehydratase family protein [candidate division KSB1 bacterium]